MSHIFILTHRRSKIFFTKLALILFDCRWLKSSFKSQLPLVHIAHYKQNLPETVVDDVATEESNLFSFFDRFDDFPGTQLVVVLWLLLLLPLLLLLWFFFDFHNFIFDTFNCTFTNKKIDNCFSRQHFSLVTNFNTIFSDSHSKCVFIYFFLVSFSFYYLMIIASLYK